MQPCPVQLISPHTSALKHFGQTAHVLATVTLHTGDNPIHTGALKKKPKQTIHTVYPSLFSNESCLNVTELHLDWGLTHTAAAVTQLSPLHI